LYVYADGEVRTDLVNWIIENVDLTPKGIIDKFNLFSLDLTTTTLYGHFGKDNLPWEQIDLF
jgi:S-adenosylmethionine synthetase